jgi:mRNA-degrading endonuclease RelE of RelBE toxin-antitoxin system
MRVGDYRVIADIDHGLERHRSNAH